MPNRSANQGANPQVRALGGRQCMSGHQKPGHAVARVGRFGLIKKFNTLIYDLVDPF
jgi:hypothetical protein